MAGRESRPISHSGDAIFREGFYAECKDLLAANRIQSIDIGQGRRLYDLGLGDFLIGYHSQEAMIADQEAFSRIELTPSPALQSPDI